MSKAKPDSTTDSPTFSRRAVLGDSVAVLDCATAVAVPTVLADTNPDAELLRLDREHDEIYARSLAVGAGPDGLDDDNCEEICETMNDIEFAIHRLPAQSLAGLAVKARLASVYFEPDSGDPLMTGIFTSLVEDILRMANVTAKHPVALPYKTGEA
jgi:hypothetical protein